MTTPPTAPPPTSPDLGGELEVDIDRMTLGDLEFVEGHTGWRAEQLAELTTDTAPPMAVMVALVAVTLRRKGEGLTYAQALEQARELPLTFAVRSAAADPTNAGGSST